MKDIRKMLDKKIDMAFREHKIPFLLGMKGLGKHEALFSYAQKRSLKCVLLVNEFPKDTNVIYYVDCYEDETYLKRLSSYLCKNREVKVVFISEKELPACMYELVSLYIQLINAKDLLFTYSDTKKYLKVKNINDLEIVDVYKKTKGNYYAIQHFLHYGNSFEDVYFKQYKHTVYNCLNTEEQNIFNCISSVDSIEKEVLIKEFNFKEENLRSLFNKGYIEVENYVFSVPSCLKGNNKQDLSIKEKLHQYYLNKGYIVKAYRTSDSEDISMYKEILALLVKEEELPLLIEKKSSLLTKAFIYYRMHKQDELRKLLEAWPSKDHDYFVASFLMEDVNFKDWVQEVEKTGMKIHLPVELFLNGFLKGRLWISDFILDQEMRFRLYELLDEETRSWIPLLRCEDAIETGNVRYAENILKQYDFKKIDKIEVKLLVSIISIRLCLALGYKEDLVCISSDILEEIEKRDDQLKVIVDLFTLEKALVLNEQSVLSDYYVNDRKYQHPYYQLLYASTLFRLNLYEKSMSKIGEILSEYTYHAYIVSHLKYVYALNLNALNNETKALKLLSESLVFNGPLRYRSYYCYFGSQTIALMNIYVRFFTTEVGKKRKRYRKSTDTDTLLEDDYHSYISSIIQGAKLFAKEDIKVVNPLTPQEIRILQCIEKGYTNLQIAEDLQIRIPTVKTHITNLFSKLGVKNRASALKEAKNNGYLK